MSQFGEFKVDLINQEELSGFTIRTLDILQYKVAIIVWHTNHVYPDKNFRYVVSISSKFQYLDPTLENLFISCNQNLSIHTRPKRPTK